MFDIGFWELAILLAIALMVVGPERLPGLVRRIGLWTGRARSYAQQLRDELEKESYTREFKESVEETRRLLDEDVMQDTGKPEQEKPKDSD